MKPDGSACIDKITGFHHMLLLAQGISRHRRIIFEIDLNLLQWFGPFPRLACESTIDGDAVMLPQNRAISSSSSVADERFQANPGYDVVSNRATRAVLALAGDSLGADRADPGCVAPPPVQSGEVEYDGRASGSAAPADHREPPR